MRTTVAAALATLSAVVILHAQTPARSPQTFRTSTDVVTVDVSVKRGNTPITGLKASDFELRDNGVLQKVERLDGVTLPIDLTLVVDLSGDPRGVAGALPNAEKVTAKLNEEIAPMAARLRPEDRIRVIGIDTYVHELVPITPVASLQPIRTVTTGGLASVYDGLLTAVLQPVPIERRHVVVARFKSRDTVSSITAAALREVAAKSDVLLHLVLMETASDTEDEVAGFQCLFLGLCWPTARFWVPEQRDIFGPRDIHPLLLDGLALQNGALATGGSLHKAELMSEPSLAGEFAKALEDFRSSYVLRYTPQNVKRDGWHEIVITIRQPGLSIRSRNGYGVETPAPVPPPPSPPAVLTTLPDLTRAYEFGMYDDVSRRLRQVTDPARWIVDFDKAGNPWPTMPRREAALALEIAESGLYSSRAQGREAGEALLERFSQLVRHPIEPDAFEHAWLNAEVSLVQGNMRPGAASPFIDRALARFPDDPRFLLARAMMTDQSWPYTGRVGTGDVSNRAEASPSHVTRLIVQYESAERFPDTAAEARVRLGWFLHRIGRSDEALRKLTNSANAMADMNDRSLRYLRLLLTGHVYAARGRSEEAIAAYRGAGDVMPGAQSARVALMNVLLSRGERAEADRLAEGVQTTPLVIDPWWLYWQGDYRHYPDNLATVRSFIK